VPRTGAGAVSGTGKVTGVRVGKARAAVSSALLLLGVCWGSMCQPDASLLRTPLADAAREEEEKKHGSEAERVKFASRLCQYMSPGQETCFP